MAETINVLSGGRDGIDLKELRALNRDLRAFKPDKQIKKVLRVAGEMIAADAKVTVAKDSRSVPPSVKVRTRKTSVSVVAGGAGVPLGGLFELGNRGRGKSQVASRGGRFRHPVFGNREVWVDQPMHPFLLSAAMRNERAIERFEGRIVADAFREVGWRGE